MQSQSNPPSGERRLGVTHCDRCGAPRPPFDDEGLCRWCHETERVAAMDVAVASLEFLEGALDTALNNNVHVDDVRALFESKTQGRTGARWTLDQLHTEMQAIREEHMQEQGESIPELMERLRQSMKLPPESADASEDDEPTRGKPPSKCEVCGRQAVRVNEHDECELCQGIQADVGVETSDVSLEILRASIRAALGRSVHPDDLREMVEEELRGLETSRPTRRELWDRSHELHKAGVL